MINKIKCLDVFDKISENESDFHAQATLHIFINGMLLTLKENTDFFSVL